MEFIDVSDCGFQVVTIGSESVFSDKGGAVSLTLSFALALGGMVRVEGLGDLISSQMINKIIRNKEPDHLDVGEVGHPLHHLQIVS